MNYPKITIVTPSYNQGQYLEQTIQSVLNQQYPNLEYIIIDGGSSDNSVDIIKKYENQLAYWISEKDDGQSHAINKGLQKATGEIFNWLNSDDYYEPNALFKIANAFQNPEVEVVCGRSRLFTNTDTTLYYSKGTDVYHNNLAKTIGWARIDQPETFFRRDIVKQIGLLDTRLHYLMDRDWWIKYLFLFGLHGVAKLNETVVNFRLHESSKTVSQSERFQIEHDTFYYSLAIQFNYSHYAQAIEKLCSVNKEFIIQTSEAYDDLLVEKALNYFLLLRANEFYAMNDKEKTKFLLSKINTSLLASVDQALHKKLHLRNTYIPTFIINTLRKNRNRWT
jgi:glycosyltransferase involved in cell wall biosynthesis